MRTLPFEYAVRNLGRSPSRLVLSVLGAALVSLLVLTAGAFVRGMEKSLRDSGGADNAMILGAGSEESVERSEITEEAVGVAMASVEGVRSRAGVPYASPEVHVQLPLTAGAVAAAGPEHAPSVMVRGVTPGAFLVHPNVQITRGRPPVPGAEEVMVGASAHTRMAVTEADLDVGRSVTIDKRPWMIVGRFAAPGTVMDSEVWTDMRDLKQATKRETISCLIVTLDPAVSELADVEVFTRMRPDLELAVLSEKDYYGQLAEFFAPIRAVAWATAGLIGLGGLLGGLNTMFAAFASRVRELGTLRALGFRRRAIALSLTQESVLTGAAGALIACGVGLAVLDGVAVRFSLGALRLTVDPGVVLMTLGAGLVLGLVGALPPAWKCLRLEVPVALKAA